MWRHVATFSARWNVYELYVYNYPSSKTGIAYTVLYHCCCCYSVAPHTHHVSRIIHHITHHISNLKLRFCLCSLHLHLSNMNTNINQVSTVANWYVRYRFSCRRFRLFSPAQFGGLGVLVSDDVWIRRQHHATSCCANRCGPGHRKLEPSWRGRCLLPFWLQTHERRSSSEVHDFCGALAESASFRGVEYRHLLGSPERPPVHSFPPTVSTIAPTSHNPLPWLYTSRI